MLQYTELLLFLLTIICAVSAYSALGMPPRLGMMLGLGLLPFFAHYLRRSFSRTMALKMAAAKANGDDARIVYLKGRQPFDIFSRISMIEWDTMFFSTA